MAIRNRDIVKQTLSYGWIVFLCIICSVTGVMVGWSSHKALVNISGENVGFIKMAIEIYRDFDNPAVFVTGFVSIGGLVLQFIRTFRGKRNNDR
jgi:hypothetical protein